MKTTVHIVCFNVKRCSAQLKRRRQNPSFTGWTKRFKNWNQKPQGKRAGNRSHQQSPQKKNYKKKKFSSLSTQTICGKGDSGHASDPRLPFPINPNPLDLLLQYSSPSVDPPPPIPPAQELDEASFKPIKSTICPVHGSLLAPNSHGCSSYWWRWPFSHSPFFPRGSYSFQSQLFCIFSLLLFC